MEGSCRERILDWTLADYRELKRYWRDVQLPTHEKLTAIGIALGVDWDKLREAMRPAPMGSKFVGVTPIAELAKHFPVPVDMSAPLTGDAVRAVRENLIPT